MCKLLESAPTFELRKGIVVVRDEYGSRAMSLGDFVVAVKRANALARKWVSESNVKAIGR